MIEMLIVIDRSGSMAGKEKDVVNGINKLIEDQRAIRSDVLVSIYKFDTQYEPIYEGAPINEARPLALADYQPRGFTALLDAVGHTIDAAGKRYAMSDHPPDGVVMVVFTDGAENASLEYTLEAVKARIDHQRTVYGWEFVFMGADIDAYAVGGSLGIPSNSIVQTTRDALHNGYASVSAMASNYLKKH